MTKFTFTFQNGRTDNVMLKELRVSAFADKTYLLPQLHDGNSANKVPSEKFTVNAAGNYDSDASLFWIDWLKDAVEKSQTGTYSPDDIGWISQYSVPDNVSYSYENSGIEIKDNCVINASGGELEYPMSFYRCESIYIPDGKKEQEYKIDYLKVKADRDKQDKEWQNLPVLKLNQVRYLFRHTHVKVNVVFGMTEVVIFARIHPWIPSEPTPPRPLEPEN